jgi:hypothetical protein
VTPALLLLCLLALPVQNEDPPPPRERVGPFSGLLAVSEFEADGRTWELEIGYGFPERARHRVSPKGARSTARRLTFRYGAALWSVAPGDAHSQAVLAANRDPILRQLELRRALLVWPHGFAWKGAGAERFAELGEFGEQVVLVRAVLDPDSGRPHTLEALDDAGILLESITEVTWMEPDAAGLLWPASLTLRDGGQVLWRERVSSVTPARLLDRYFQPTDRREGSGTPTRQYREFLLPEAVGKRVALEQGLTLDAALIRADEWIAGAARTEQDPDTVLRDPVLLLDRSGRPTAVWIQRSSPPAPEGWEVRPSGEALGLFLASPRALGPRDSTDLLKAVLAKGRAPGTLFLRIQAPREGPRRAELVLVLKPE